ncbi:hypothetical protein ACYTTA_004550, partial [Escherichia coli]
RHISKPISYFKIHLLSGISGGQLIVMKQANLKYVKKHYTAGDFCVAGCSGNALCSGCRNDAIKRGATCSPTRRKKFDNN